MDTYRGTITNNNGEYILKIASLPAKVKFSYIGYRSQIIVISESSPARHDILLEPSIIEMAEIVVTDEDPAVNIMRKVIERKQQWREELETYAAEAYSRMTIENDSGIVMISETISKAFWGREKGPREIVKIKT